MIGSSRCLPLSWLVGVIALVLVFRQSFENRSISKNCVQVRQKHLPKHSRLLRSPTIPKSSSNTLATYRLFSSEAMVSNWNGLTSFPIPMARTSTPLSRRLWAARERFSSDISGEGCGVCVPSVSTKAIWKQERQRLRKQGLPGVDFEVMIDVDFQGKLQCSEIPKFSTAIHAKTDLLPSNYQCHTAKVGYLTVILRGRAGYELIYNQRGRRPSWLLSAHIRQVREE